MLDQSAYLTVDEAAERLGISTIRLRLWIREKRVQAVVDNQGRWRVRLDADPSNVAPVPMSDPTQAVDVLIDEIMELRQALNESRQSAERLKILAGRQQEVLAQAIDRAETERAARAAAEERAVALDDRVKRALDIAEAALVRAERAKRG